MKNEGNNLAQSTPEHVSPGRPWRIAYIVYVAGWFFTLLYLLLRFWPQKVPESGAELTTQNVQLLGGFVSVNLTGEMQLILIVAIMGALGGFAYSVNLFAYYIGVKKFDTSYSCWYVLRPLIGSILAIIFYFAFRGAFFSVSFSGDTQNLSTFGMATVGGIAGIFSKETMEKLRELFYHLFNIKTEEEKKGSLGEPRVKSLSPRQSWRIAYIVYVAGWFFILLYLLLRFWPQPPGLWSETVPATQNVQLLGGVASVNLTEEMQLILIMAIMGALGGFAYSVNLFAYYIGVKEFDTSYSCWYVLRPLIGSILAVIFCFAFRGVFFSFSGTAQNLDIFGMATVSGMAGIFSQEILKKGGEIFRQIFNIGT